jgi:hypothetical protein
MPRWAYVLCAVSIICEDVSAGWRLLPALKDLPQAVHQCSAPMGIDQFGLQCLLG